MRLLEALRIVTPLAPLGRASNTYTATGIDTIRYDELSVLLVLGAITAGGSVVLTFEESDDFSNWSTLAGVSLSADDQNANQTLSLGLRIGGRANRKRYIRAVAEVDSSGVNLFGVLFLLSSAHAEPVVNVPASVLA